MIANLHRRRRPTSATARLAALFVFGCIAAELTSALGALALALGWGGPL